MTAASGSKTAAPVPTLFTPMLRGFCRYLDFYFRRNFHAVRLSYAGQPADLQDWPLLVCLNHPSWWDPLLSLYLSQRLYPNRSHYGPIESKALARYGFFRKLGFFGIEPGTVSGAQEFLRVGAAVLSSPERALWVTAQGHFTDVRRRPVTLRSGVGHLAHRLQRCAMLPLAIEYTYWDERLPEALVRFGPPVFIEEGRSRPANDWTRLFAEGLEQTQDALMQDAFRREASLFQPLVSGAAGVGGVYDVWRSTRAKLRGETFQKEHGSYDA